MSRWIVWWDLRKAAAYAITYDGLDLTDEVQKLPGPTEDFLEEGRLRAARGVMMTAAEICAILRLWPLVSQHMDPTLMRESRKLIEQLNSISTVDLMASLG